jgi:hypothetical protein
MKAGLEEPPPCGLVACGYPIRTDLTLVIPAFYCLLVRAGLTKGVSKTYRSCFI